LTKIVVVLIIPTRMELKNYMLYFDIAKHLLRNTYNIVQSTSIYPFRKIPILGNIYD